MFMTMLWKLMMMYAPTVTPPAISTRSQTGGKRQPRHAALVAEGIQRVAEDHDEDEEGGPLDRRIEEPEHGGVEVEHRHSYRHQGHEDAVGPNVLPDPGAYIQLGGYPLVSSSEMACTILGVS